MDKMTWNGAMQAAVKEYEMEYWQYVGKVIEKTKAWGATGVIGDAVNLISQCKAVDITIRKTKGLIKPGAG